MKAEDLFLNNSSEGKVVEELCELLPDLGIAVLSQALVVESVASNQIEIIFLSLTPG